MKEINQPFTPPGSQSFKELTIPAPYDFMDESGAGIVQPDYTSASKNPSYYP